MMSQEAKDEINLMFNMLKTTISRNGAMFAILVDKKDPNQSRIAFVDKEEYFKNGKIDGIQISLDEMNKEI